MFIPFKLADTELRVGPQLDTGLTPDLVSTTLSTRFSRSLSYVADVVAYLILLAGIATAFSTAYLMRVGYSVVPYWDEMHEVQLYVSQRQSLLRWMWAQHNEHRIVFYKLLFILDMHLFKGRHWPMFIGIFCCQGIVAVIFASVLWKMGCQKRSAWIASFGIILYCLFCPSQWENFSWAFQLSFALVTVWATTAILLVVFQKQRLDQDQPLSGWTLPASLAVAAAASFTSGNGIIVWPIMIALAVSMALPWRLIGLYVLGFAGSASLYMVGYGSIPTHHAHPLESLQKPLQVLQFIENYFGGALVTNNHLDWAAQIGQTGLLIAVVMICLLIGQRDKASLLDYFLAGILLYSLTTAVITSLGRLTLGVDQPFASRYQGFALLFWCALVVWLISVLARRRAATQLVTVYLLALFVIVTSGEDFGPILERVRNVATNRDVGGVALIVGVHDDNFIKQAVCPFPDVTWAAVEYLREHSLSLFSETMAKQLRQDLSSTYTVTAANSCRGSVDVVQQADNNLDGLSLEGWIVDRHSRPVPRLLFVEGGKIVGFGVSGRQRVDVVKAVQSKAALRSGWVGYANISEVGRPIDVYGVVDFGKGKACYLRTVSFNPEAESAQ
jgi:hypothetical protein